MGTLPVQAGSLPHKSNQIAIDKSFLLKNKLSLYKLEVTQNSKCRWFERFCFKLNNRCKKMYKKRYTITIFSGVNRYVFDRLPIADTG